MKKIFEFNSNDGSYIDRVSNVEGIPTSVNFIKSDKGLSLKLTTTSSRINYPAIIRDTGLPWTIIIRGLKIEVKAANNNIIGEETASSYLRIMESSGVLQRVVMYGVNSSYINLDWGVITPSFERPTKRDIVLRCNGITVELLVDNISFGTRTPTGGATGLNIKSIGSNIRTMLGVLDCVEVYENFLTNQNLAKLNAEYIRRSRVENNIRNFEYPTLTDLSSEVDANLGINLTKNYDFNTWIKVEGAGKTVITTENTITLEGSNGAGVTQVLLVVGRKYRLKIKGLNTSNSFSVVNRDTGLVVTLLSFGSGSFNDVVDFVATHASIYLRINIGTVTIEAFSITDLTGLIAAYSPSKDTVQGSRLLDISGNNYHGIIAGAVLTKKGIIGGLGKNITTTVLQTSSGSLLVKFKTSTNLTTEQMILGSMAGATSRNYLSVGGSGSIAKLGAGIGADNRINVQSATTLLENKEYTGAITWNGTTINLYLNGRLEFSKAQNGTLSFTGGHSICALNLNFSIQQPFLGELQDARIYNYAFTPEQVKAYHNSFIQPSIIDNFTCCPVGNSRPINWQNRSGSFVIKEEYIVNQNFIVNGSFNDGSTNWIFDSGWSLQGNWAVKVSSTNFNYIRQTLTTPVKLNKRYRLSYNLNSGSGSGLILSSALFGTTISLLGSGSGLRSVEFNVTTSFSTMNTLFIGQGSSSWTGQIKDIKLEEIPMLPEIITKSKYLENVTAGVMAIPSANAYGVWEFNVYKNLSATDLAIPFAVDRAGGYLASVGYMLRLSDTQRIVLSRNLVGSTVALMFTPVSYIVPATWYGIRIVRNLNENVFKNIPTLQTSNIINSIAAPYSTFQSISNSEFKATNIAGNNAYSGTNTEITFGITEKFLVEFDMKLNSGVGPNVLLMNTLGSGTSSNSVVAVDGKNNIILTATSTRVNGVVAFWNFNTATDFEISNLTIRRIYPADTFAVFIKGGTFGNRWTLVNTTGGSGSNPITNSLYTTSNYFVFNAGVGDRITNLKIFDGEKI